MGNRLTIIDLEKYLLKDSNYLSGRADGELVRKKYKLDEIDNDFDHKVKIIISKRFIGINVSFFLGLLSISVNKCGSKENFLEKFEFEIDPEIKDIIWEDIEYGLEEALDDTNPADLYSK